MRMSYLFVSALSAITLFGQAPSAVPEVAPDTVVATIDGTKFTASEMKRLVDALPAAVQQNFQRDKKEFVRQYGVMLHLAKMAEQSKLDQRSPTRERLDFVRMQVLVQAQVDEATAKLDLPPEEQKKYYEVNKDRFTQAKVKVIYIPFSTNPSAQAAAGGKKILSEAEAQAKSESVVKQIRGGADFVKMVKEHSEDPTSAGKDGDFGTLKKGDNLPEPVKKTIFSLKAGEVSDPVKQPNGFYIFRVESAGTQPFEEVTTVVHNELKQAKFQEWFTARRNEVQVKFESEPYFAPAPAPAPVQPVPVQPGVPPAK